MNDASHRLGRMCACCDRSSKPRTTIYGWPTAIVAGSSSGRGHTPKWTACATFTPHYVMHTRPSARPFIKRWKRNSEDENRGEENESASHVASDVESVFSHPPGVGN